MIYRRDTGVAPLDSPARKRWWAHDCERAGGPISANVYYNCPYCGQCKSSWLSSQKPAALRRKRLHQKLVELAVHISSSHEKGEKMVRAYTSEEIQQKYLADLRACGFFDKDNPHGMFDGDEEDPQPQFRLDWEAVNAPRFTLVQGDSISASTFELLKASDVVWTQPYVHVLDGPEVGYLVIELLLIDEYTPSAG